MIPLVLQLLSAKLASVIHDGYWKWGVCRSENLVTILSQLLSIDIGDANKAWWIPS